MGQRDQFEKDERAPEAARPDTEPNRLQDQFLAALTPETRARSAKTDSDASIKTFQFTNLERYRPVEVKSLSPAEDTGLIATKLSRKTGKEPDLNTSINGVPRFLDSMDEPATPVKGQNKGADKGNNSRYPSDLAQTVPHQDLAKYKQAFDLLRAYQDLSDKQVAQPAKRELAQALDKAERNMTPGELKKLEKERLLYGKALERQESHEIPDGDIAMRSLVYYPDPTRGKAMKEFDEKARGLALQTLEQARPRQAKIDSSEQFGSKLDEAVKLIETYNKLKEAKEAPKWDA